MEVTSRPAFATLMLALLILGLYLNYGHYAFYRDPGSIFFKPAFANEKKYSLVREAEARQWLNDLHEQNSSEAETAGHERGHDADICVGMATVRRDSDPSTTDVTIASILEGLTSPEQHSLYISVLFAQNEPSTHPSWQNAPLLAQLHDVWSYDDPDLTLPDPLREALTFLSNSTDLSRHQIHAKGLLDYSLVLQRCLLRTKAPYLALFEDDVLVARGWVARTMAALRDVDGRYPQPGRDWLHLRLFNQERSTGWASRTIGSHNEVSIVAIIDAVLVVAWMILRRSSLSARRFATSGVLVVVCAVGVPAAIILLFASGKASLFPPARGVVAEDFGCCSQALVFNRRQAAALADALQAAIPLQLDGREDDQYDQRTKHFAQAAGLDRWAFYPMQVQHRGKVSSVGASPEEAAAVWSMAFEDLNPEMLQRNHEAAMRAVYGAQE